MNIIKREKMQRKIKVCLGIGLNQLFPEEIEIPIYTETKFYQVMNRYGQPIRFIESESGFMMKGGDYYRYLFNEGDDGYYAVDPSGGPFISVGTDLSIVHKKLKGLTVKEIKISNEGEIELIINK